MDCLYKDIDYTNKTVGGYEVLGFSHIHTFPSGQTTHYWKVKCIHCGTERTSARQKVIQSFQGGCASCVKDRFSGVNSFNWNEDNILNVPSMYYHAIKGAAAKRKIDFNLSRKDLDDLFIKQKGKCIYTGFDLYFGDNKKRGTASLDRIDSNLGYTVDNVQWIHKDANLMKMDLTHDRFIEICKIITENNKNV